MKNKTAGEAGGAKAVLMGWLQVLFGMRTHVGKTLQPEASGREHLHMHMQVV